MLENLYINSRHKMLMLLLFIKMKIKYIKYVAMSLYCMYGRLYMCVSVCVRAYVCIFLYIS